MQNVKFRKMVSVSFAVGVLFFSGYSFAGAQTPPNNGVTGGGMMGGGIPEEFLRHDATKINQGNKTVVVIKSHLCHEEKGSCKEVTSSTVRTLDKAAVPIENAEETSFVSGVMDAADQNGKEVTQVFSSTVLTGAFESFSPVVEKNGRVLISYSIKLTNLKGIRALKNGVQFPVVDKLVSTTGKLTLSQGRSGNIDLGKGFRLIISARVPAKATKPVIHG